MDTSLLQALSRASKEAELESLIQTHGLNIQTVEALKARATDLHYSQPDEALQLAETAHRLGNLLPAPAPALGCWVLGNALLFSDRYQEAVHYLGQAQSLYLDAGLPLEAARAGVGHVGVLAYTGAFEEALALADEIEPALAASAQDDVQDRRRLGSLLTNAGIAHELMGQYEEALAAYDRHLEIARALGNPLEVAHAQNNRGCTLTFLHSLDEALDAFDQAEAEFVAANATADLVRVHLNRGILYALWRRYPEAETALAEADRCLATLEGMEPQRCLVALYQGMAHLQSEEPADRALLQTFRAAQPVLATHGPRFEEGLAWLGQGRCHLELGEEQAAQGAFEQAQALAAQGAGRPLAYLALHGLGNLAAAQGKPAQAIAAYQAALQQVETMRRDLQVETFRAGFVTDKLVIYQDLVLLYLQQGELEQAFMTIERAKSRLLAERLNQQLGQEAVALAASPEPAERELASQIQALLARLDTLYGEARLGGGEDERGFWPASPPANVLTEIEELETEINTLVRRLERQHPRFAPLATGYVVPLERLAPYLDEAFLIQYHVARGRVGAFLVNADGLQKYYDLTGVKDVQEPRRRFMAAVSRILGLGARYGLEVALRYADALQADADRQLTRLYDQLWHPLAADLPPGCPLVVIPDGPLHYVPFHALRVSPSAYLIEQHPISYAPSATVLALCQEQTPAGRGTLLVGYGEEHMPHTTVEIEALSRIFPDAHALLDKEATVAQVLDRAPHCRVLHLATHARFRADNVMLSSLALADRNLTLAEVSRLPLGAELVTLSGCETARGRLHGADLISLAQGFMGAGAASLLVSLWRVDDAAAARLMTAFYRALTKGHSRVEALQQAQCQALEACRQATDHARLACHPAYWAPFVLMGRGGGLDIGY